MIVNILKVPLIVFFLGKPRLVFKIHFTLLGEYCVIVNLSKVDSFCGKGLLFFLNTFYAFGGILYDCIVYNLLKVEGGFSGKVLLV